MAEGGRGGERGQRGRGGGGRRERGGNGRTLNHWLFLTCKYPKQKSALTVWSVLKLSAATGCRLCGSCKCVFCPQVVYSSSVDKLKVETVKPDTPEKEEDDIDIDAIWDSDDDDDAFLVLWLGLTMFHLKRLGWPVPSFTHPPPPPALRTLLCFVAWLNIALYLLHINSVILRCIQLMKWSRFGDFNHGVFGDQFDCTLLFFFFFFGPCIFPVQ